MKTAFLRPVRGLSGGDHPRGRGWEGLQGRREEALRRRQAGQGGGVLEVACGRPQRWLQRGDGQGPTWRKIGDSGPAGRTSALASLDKRAWPPHGKRANSLAGEDIDESNCFWPAGCRPARRPNLGGRRRRLRRRSLSRGVRRTAWRGRYDPPPIRLPRRRGGAPCLWRALLLARAACASAAKRAGEPRATQAPASFAIAGAGRATRILAADRIGRPRGGRALRRPRACAIGQDRNDALSAGGSRRNWPWSPISIN